MTAVRAVVFDIGGVLFDWHPRYLYEKLIADAVERERFLAEVVTLDWHFRHDAGRDFRDTSRELIERHPQHRALIEAFRPRFNETIGKPIAGMHELVAELDGRGVPLFGITNFSHEFFPPFAALHTKLFRRFRDIVVSGAEKLVKPDAAIYRLARERFGLAPGEGLFVDDRRENARGSETEGFVRYHFHDAAVLRRDLEHHGLL